MIKRIMQLGLVIIFICALCFNNCIAEEFPVVDTQDIVIAETDEIEEEIETLQNEEQEEEKIRVLNPNRSIGLDYYWDGKPRLNGIVTFIAILDGYEELEYTVQWQRSPDNVQWDDVPNANELSCPITVTIDNYSDYWRIKVIITGFKE